ncbi:MAG: ATP-binding protein [Myxococcota bacterium]
MGLLATVVIAWAAVYGYVSLYYVILYLRRPTDREYLAFAMIAAGMCLFSVARVLQLRSDSIAEALVSSRVSWAGVLLTVASFVDFCHALVGRRSWLTRATYLFCGVSVALSLLGLTVDQAEFARTSGLRLVQPPDYNVLRITPAGAVILVGGLGLAAAAVARLLPAARHDRDIRIMVAGTAVAVVAGAHDVLLRVGMLQSVFLLEHAAMVVIIVMSYLLLERYVRTSRELRERTAELDRSYHELRETQEQLVRKEQLAAVGELSAVIAHEVRNPLAIIKNAVSGLRRSTLAAEDRRTLLGILGEETGRLTRLVDDLIAYARPMMPEDRRVHLHELVWGALDLARSGNPDARNVAITVDLHAAPETVQGDPALLRQALMNLIDNAIQAMRGGGELAVRARPSKLDERPALAIEIRDTGEGMDTLVREKATHPFFTTRPAGTGLGLAIVERVVRNHGGSLRISSRHGVGTVVVVTLPNPGPRDDTPAPPEAAEPPQPSPGGL